MAETALAVISKELRGNEVMVKISASMGKPATDPDVLRFINGAIMQMGEKPDILRCTKQSIIDSLINAATVRLPVDNRKLAHLVPFGGVCTFMPDYKGYLYKVKEADPTADVTVGIVYKGDEFTCEKESGRATYKHVVKNPFEDTPANIVGLYCYVKSDSGSWLEVMSQKELMKVKSQSKMKTGAIWATWEIEMLKKSMVRRALKIKFNEAIAELDALDNKLFNERPEKIAPSIASDSAPLPAERHDIQEAEVVGGEEGKAPAAAAEPEKPAGQSQSEEKTETSGDIQTITGGIEKYYPPKGKGPHSWKVEGRYFQMFDTEKDGTDNSEIIKKLKTMDEAMVSVKIAYRESSYKNNGLEIKTNNIINVYPAEKGE